MSAILSGAVCRAFLPSLRQQMDLVGKDHRGKGHRDLLEGRSGRPSTTIRATVRSIIPTTWATGEGAYTPTLSAFTARCWEEQPGFDPWHRSLAGRDQPDAPRLSLTPVLPFRTTRPAGWPTNFFDARNRRHLGCSIPILSTENGYCGRKHRPRHLPRLAPDSHTGDARPARASRQDGREPAL
ncbi:MAG: hypothetical protein R2911_30550 [Caldilineaceae bacterium]